jgi:hypothetical protein
MSLAKALAFQAGGGSSRSSGGAKVMLVQKEFFFDREGIKKKVRQSKKKNLEATGVLTRTIARRSMKKAPKQFTKSGKRKKLSRYGYMTQVKSGRNKGKDRFKKGQHSPAGQPPYYHGADHHNLRSIMFAYNPKRDDLVVHTQRTRGSTYMTKPAPILQEAGGTAKKVRGNGGTWNFPARPYMAPAGEKGVEFLKKKMRNGIK